MSRIRAIMGGVLALFAIGAAASAAQAAPHYVIEGTEVTSSTPLKHVEELGTTNALLGTPFGVAVHIQCTHRVILNASIGTAGTGTAKIEFSSCTVTKPTNCTLKQPITIKVNTTLEEPSGGVFENKVKSESGPFTEITLEGASCTLKNSPFAVEGTQKCALPSAGTEAVKHELECKPSGSALTLGGKAATFESSPATLELESGKKWSASGAGGSPKVTITPTAWSGGGECPKKEGRVPFTVIGQWCEYVVKNESGAEKVTIEATKLEFAPACTFEGGLFCLGFATPGKLPECKKAVVLVAGGECWIRVEYLKKPGAKSVTTARIETKSEGGVVASAETGQIAE